jgi:hypothetical protein
VDLKRAPVRIRALAKKSNNSGWVKAPNKGKGYHFIHGLKAVAKQIGADILKA